MSDEQQLATVPTPNVDDIFGEAADEELPTDFDEQARSFWTAFLRDLHGYDEDELAQRPNAWVWNRAHEVMT